MNKALLAVLTLGLGVGLLTIGACSDRKKKETTELMEVKKDPFTSKSILKIQVVYGGMSMVPTANTAIFCMISLAVPPVAN